MTAPVLVTERFDLWQPRASDFSALVALIEPEDTRRYLGAHPVDESAEFARMMRNAGSWALYGYGIFAVRPRGEGDLVATCGVFRSHRGFGAAKGLDDVAEAGWIVRSDWTGRGVAREAMSAIMAWFDAVHGPQRVACMIEDGNAASFAVARRLGFREYGRHRPEGEVRELVLMERLR